MACEAPTEGGRAKSWRMLSVRSSLPSTGTWMAWPGAPSPLAHSSVQILFSLFYRAAPCFQSPPLQGRNHWWSCWDKEIWGRVLPWNSGKVSESLLPPPWSREGEWVLGGTWTQCKLCTGCVNFGKWLNLSLSLLPYKMGRLFVISSTKPSWRKHTQRGMLKTANNGLSSFGGRGSSVSAELDHVMKFLITSSLTGKSSQSVFSLSQMSFNYALTCDYGRNSIDYLFV